MCAQSCAVALMVCLLPAFAETNTSSSPIAILFRFDRPYSQAALREMQRELTTLMKPSAVRPEWHDRKDITASASFQKLVLVNFHGRCGAETAAGPNLPARASRPREAIPLGI